MYDQLADRFAELPGYLGGHMLLSTTALLVGMAISLPLGILVSRRPRWTEPVLGVAGIIQTIPSLALLALVMDQLIRLLEVAARRRSRRMAWAGALGLLVVLGGGLYAPAAEFLRSHANRVIVGSGQFTEQHILSELLATELAEAGFQ